MEAIDRVTRLRARVEQWRATGQRVGLVPTMGHLHAGHLALLEALKQHCERTVVSIFVNPTQFGPEEDFGAYPRTRESDLERLREAGCDAAWLPDEATMYPLDEPFMIQAPPRLAKPLCGHFRPGHFDGVATVVLKLFSQVGPEVAAFGEKDFQQLLIIRRLVEDFSLPVHIVGMATVREADGLALSSRNRYLSAAERARAPLIHRTLSELARELGRSGDWVDLKRQAIDALGRAGFDVQYLEWRSADDLGPPRPDRPQRLLIAAQLGSARLIDNVDL